MGTSPSDPSWVKEGVEPLLTRVRPYVEVGLRVVRDPAQFARSWVDGTSAPMNPLSLVASAAAVVGIGESLAHEVAGLPFKPSAWEYAVRGIAPYVYYIELGVLLHIGLWIVGARGRKVTTAVAFVLYSGGTLATVATLLLLGWMVAARRAVGPHLADIVNEPIALQAILIVTLIIIFAIVVRFVGSFGHMARVAYDVSRPRIVGAMIFTLVGSSLISRALPLPTLQLVLGEDGARIHYPDFVDFFDRRTDSPVKLLR